MAGQPNNESDSAAVYLVALIVGVVIAIALLDYYIDGLLVVWRYMRMAELWILSFIPSWVPYFGALPVDDALACLRQVNQCLDGEKINAATASAIDDVTMAHFSWVPGLFFIIVGVRHLMKGESVSTTHNMESLLKQNAPLYDNISPFTDAHPELAPLHWNRADPETAEFGFSVSPERFAKMNPPLGCVRDAKKNTAYRQAIWDGDLFFDAPLAQDVFSRQLSNRFTGIENLSKVEKGVFDQLTNGLTFSENSILSMLENALSKTPDLSLDCDARIVAAIKERTANPKFPKDKKARMKALLADKGMDPFFRYGLAERILQKHGFVITGLMSLLDEARQGGVVAGCELLWVKRKSRNLWYALSSVGRRVAFTEGAGSYAHWLIERHLDRPITHPEVYEAVVGLEKALKMDIRRANSNEEPE